MIIVELLIALAHLDHAPNRRRHLGLQPQCVLQRVRTGRPLRLRVAAERIGANQVRDVGAGQLAAHQQVLDQFVAVLALLAGRRKEELCEARPIDGVAREMGAHHQVAHRGVDLLLDLAFHLANAAGPHVDPVLGHVRLARRACGRKKDWKNGQSMMMRWSRSIVQQVITQRRRLLRKIIRMICQNCCALLLSSC